MVLGILVLGSGMLLGAQLTIMYKWNEWVKQAQDVQSVPDRTARTVTEDSSRETYQEITRIMSEHLANIQIYKDEYSEKVHEEIDRLEDRVAAILPPEHRTAWMNRFQRLREIHSTAPLSTAPRGRPLSATPEMER